MFSVLFMFRTLLKQTSSILLDSGFFFPLTPYEVCGEQTFLLRCPSQTVICNVFTETDTKTKSGTA